jgi:predicted RNA-binding protein Jag
LRGQQDMADRLIADQIEVAGFEEAQIAVTAKIMTGQELSIEDEAAEAAAIRGVVRQGVERADGVAAVEVSRAGDGVRVDVHTAQPDTLVGHRGAKADRIRGDLEELTGGPVLLNFLWAPGPQETDAAGQ